MKLALLLFLSLGAGCGDDNGNNHVIDPIEATADGWTAFDQGNWVAAEEHFRTAIEADSTFSEAHNGLAWCCAHQDSFQDANQHFDMAIALGITSAEPYAGKAAVLRDTSPADYEGAIDAATEALTIEPGFTFGHDTTFDWRDLRLILAQSYFALGQYFDANAQVDSLGGDVQDPDAEDFVEALLKEIEVLLGEA